MVPSKSDKLFCVAEDLGAFVWPLLRCESASYLRMSDFHAISQEARLPPNPEDCRHPRLHLHISVHSEAFQGCSLRHCSIRQYFRHACSLAEID